MLKNIQVAFIGGGTMAEAVLKGLLGKDFIHPSRIVVSEPRAERGVELRTTYGVSIAADNPAAVEHAGVVVLSVKPQVVPQVLAELKGRIPEQALVLSIVAGVKIAAISEGLSHPAIVRSMPNTPAQVGQGMTVWSASAGVTPPQREQAGAILGALGKEIFVEDENYLDMATALSGSGPAYVFLFMEALVDAGVHLGFIRPVAEELVLQTVKGSVEYALQTPLGLAQLRDQVTSPGGTTSEALYYLDKAGFRTAISRALYAAYQRSVQLGKDRTSGGGKRE
jgi:pyrroline-5-carboxylate reductase